MQALRPASRVLALRAGKPAVPLTRGEWITAVFQGVNNALHSSSTVTRETFTHRKQTGKLHQIILTSCSCFADLRCVLAFQNDMPISNLRNTPLYAAVRASGYGFMRFGNARIRASKLFWATALSIIVRRSTISAFHAPPLRIE